jgi:putative sigma-54 modulation protein
MEILITGRNIGLDDSLKEYVNKKMSKLERLYSNIRECEVILEEEKLRKNVEVILHIKGNRLVAKETSGDIYASIDNASDNIQNQLRRLRDKAGARRHRNVLDRLVMPVFRRRRGSGAIIPTDDFANKPMSPEEAKLEIEVLGLNFITFKNADSGKVNVLYKRNDGNYGLIESNF